MSGEQQKLETKARENLERLTSDDLWQNTITEEVKSLKSELTKVNAKLDSVNEQVSAYKTVVEAYKESVKVYQQNTSDSSAVSKYRLDSFQWLLLLVLGIICTPILKQIWN